MSTLVMPNVGEVLALKNLLGHTAADTPLKLKLFSNDRTPASGDTAASYTEVAGGGYANVSFTGASWTVTAGSPSTASYAAQTFTFTGTTTAPGTIYGYYVTNNTGILLWAQRLTSPPFTPAVNGDSVVVTPQITLGSDSGD